MRLCRLAIALVTIGGSACTERVIDAVRGVTDERLDAGVDEDEPAARQPSLDGAAASFRSCAEILAANPNAPSGPYVIDPDAAGPLPVIEVTCEHEGGWTRLATFDFENDVSGFTRNEVTTCGALGRFLGGYRVFGSEAVATTIDLRGVPHSELRLRFEFVAIDSWDGEVAFAEVDGARIWRVRCGKDDPRTCGQASDQCGWEGPFRNDGKVAVDVTTAHLRDSALIEFGAMLDQSKRDESWGIDNVSVSVR